jgi:hypothetical protein
MYTYAWFRKVLKIYRIINLRGGRATINGLKDKITVGIDLLGAHWCGLALAHQAMDQWDRQHYLLCPYTMYLLHPRKQ